MSKQNTNKVFILGLDGATFRIIKPMIKAGKLPNLNRLMAQGTHGVLNSTILTNSAPAWTSFATGKNPGKHSISGFTRLTPNAYQLSLLKGSDNRTKTIWEVLGPYGKKSIVVNIPMTYPPKKINGILVSGLDTPSLSTQFTYPPELKDELLRRVPDYKINLHLGGYLHNHKRRLKAMDVMLSSTRAREKAVLHLMQNHAWDFFTVRFNSPDNVQHQFWKFMDQTHLDYDPHCPEPLKNAIFTLYEELDRVLASILNHLPAGCTLVVMSDHGAGPRTNKTIRLNEWLQSRELLECKASHQRRKNFLYQFMEKTLSTLLKRVPPGLKQWLMKLFPKAISKTWTYIRFPNIDWEKTRAFVGETEGIRINSRATYPLGIVGDEEYECLRDHIISEVKKLKDPDTGEHVIQLAAKREEIFSGPYVNEFPDIITIPLKEQYNISSRIQQKRKQSKAACNFVAREEHWRKVSGSHRREGIFIIHGRDIKQNLRISPASIMDIFPTVLYTLGLPLPKDLDGRVLTEVFTDGFIERNPVKYADEEGLESDSIQRIEYSDEEKETLADHLRGLGYIE